MSKRKLGHMVWVATMMRFVDAGSPLPSVRLPRGGASLREEGPQFLGSFEDEIRKIREEIESETRECFEQLEQQVRQSRWGDAKEPPNQAEQEGNVNEPLREWPIGKDTMTNATSNDANTSTTSTFIAAKKKRSPRRRRKQVVEKTRKPLLTPPTRRTVVTVSGGGLESVRKKSEHDILIEEKEELVRARRLLQYELEHVQKDMSRKELYRASLTGVMLVFLCILTTLALRVVEASLGVP
ncbi:hypothetical protein MHU86_9896 [Fragilaria crotonensis]|nr:hypothetical protein MHU86_9896 [Fragilaria crotonensis]